MKIGVFQINPLVGDIWGNSRLIVQKMEEAKKKGAEIVLFPEMALCGYPPEDLLFFRGFLRAAREALKPVIRASRGLFAVVGTVREEKVRGKRMLFNSAAIIADGRLLGFKDKSRLPDYDVFNESRYFQEGKKERVWIYKKQRIGVLICEDAWKRAQKQRAEDGAEDSLDPVAALKKLRPDLVLVLAASPYYLGKKKLREDIYAKSARDLKCPLVFCNQVGGNDGQVFDGQSFFLDRRGRLIERAEGFLEKDFWVETGNKLTPKKTETEEPVAGLYQALVLGIRDYFRKQSLAGALVALSGGIDSALTACLAVEALGNKNVLAVSMPSRFSSASSIEDAHRLAENLKIKILDLPIDGLFQSFLTYLSPFFYGKSFSVAEENLQPRIRSTLLMALSNKLGQVVLSTGNKSELAMGYMTLYGDMCGGLAVLSDVKKGFVYQLSKYVNREKELIPKSVLVKAPSAELRANQKDADDLPPYPVVDLVLEEYVEEHLEPEKIAKKHQLKKALVKDLVGRIHKAEYKRRQGPVGIIVTKKAFGRGRCFPIVQGWVR
jgi:NAD+ synthase (glutamine-hydrolysing)